MKDILLKYLATTIRMFSILHAGFDLFAVTSSVFAMLAVIAVGLKYNMIAGLLSIIGYIFFLLGNAKNISCGKKKKVR